MTEQPEFVVPIGLDTEVGGHISLILNVDWTTLFPYCCDLNNPAEKLPDTVIAQFLINTFWKVKTD